jgi:hypothetical protein
MLSGLLLEHRESHFRHSIESFVFRHHLLHYLLDDECNPRLAIEYLSPSSGNLYLGSGPLRTGVKEDAKLSRRLHPLLNFDAEELDY